jgi:hypothetical protein
MNLLAIAGRALGFRPPLPKPPSPIWPSAPLTTSASSVATAVSPRRRSFAEIISQSRPAAPPVVAARVVAAPARPQAVVGAGAGEFGVLIRRFAPVRLAASRPAPAVHAPRRPAKDFSHLTGSAVPPVDAPRLPQQPDPAFSVLWQQAFRRVFTGERPPAYRSDPQTAKEWKRAFAKVLGEQPR